MSGSTGGFAFATQIRSREDIKRAAEAVRMHDKPFNMLEMFPRYTEGNPHVVTIGGQQNDAPKGPPFLDCASLVRYNGDTWLVVVSPGEDISAPEKRCGDLPHVTEAAELSGNYLSFYYPEMHWHGVACCKTDPSKTWIEPICQTKMLLPQEPLPLPPALVEGSSAALRGGAEVAARSLGADWTPLWRAMAA